VLDASVRHHLSRQVSVDLQIKNVTDRQYAYVWDNGGSPMFSPAAGRSGFVSLNVKL
jgi:iron complex outermembrane recepter protein